MNGVTGDVVGVLPWGTTTFSQISITVRRFSAGSVSSPTVTWCFVLNVGDEICFVLKDVNGVCSRFEDGDRGIFELHDTLELTGIGISDAFGQDNWLVGLLTFDVLVFNDGVLEEDGEMGGLREEVELVGDDLVPIVFRGSGVGIFDAARGDVTGVVIVFGTSFAIQFEAEVALDSNWRFVGTAATLTGDSEQVSITAESNGTGDEAITLVESSFEAPWTFSSTPNFGSCSFAQSLLLHATEFDSLAGRESVLVSKCSLGPGNFGLGSISGGDRRGGTLGLWYTIGRLVAG